MSLSDTSVRQRNEENSARRSRSNGGINRLSSEDRLVHGWYRFVLSFPPHLVDDYFERFGLDEKCFVLDAFCRMGTTVAEAKRHGISSLGIEAHPMAQFASRVKVDRISSPEALWHLANRTAEQALEQLRVSVSEDEPIFHPDDRPQLALRELPREGARLLLQISINPLPFHKTLVLLVTLKSHQDQPFYRHELLALTNAAVFSISNLKFAPEAGVGKPKVGTSVINVWLTEVKRTAVDLRALQIRRDTPSTVHRGDSCDLTKPLAPKSIDAVITSPPNPKEKDSTRTTRLESVLLGFINTRDQLQALKRRLMRWNTRTVYKGNDDDRWVAGNMAVQRLTVLIEQQHIEMGKTSGFKRLYAKVTRLIFGSMTRHLAELRRIFKPGAWLADVVGDQASFLQVMIRTDQLLADIALSLVYEVVSINLFRTRLATATGE